jgi:predicted nucleic acid-binding protein
MATSGKNRCAVDTSIAVAALDATHASHASARLAVVANTPVLSGHAAFETFSVLTRLPGALRLSAIDAASALRLAFGVPCWLSGEEQTDLFARLNSLGVTGGGIYDALVGEAARVHNRMLLTGDARAARTYGLVGVKFELVA